MRIQRIGVVWAVALLGLLPSCDSLLEAIYGKSTCHGWPPCACEEVWNDPANYPLASASRADMEARIKEFYEGVTGGYLRDLTEWEFPHPSLRVFTAADMSSGGIINVSVSTVTGRVRAYHAPEEDRKASCAAYMRAEETGVECGSITRDKAFAMALPFLRYDGQPTDIAQYHMRIDNSLVPLCWNVFRMITHENIARRNQYVSVSICAFTGKVLSVTYETRPLPASITPRIGKEEALSAAIAWARRGNSPGRVTEFHLPEVTEGIHLVISYAEDFPATCYCPTTEGLSPLGTYLTWAVPIEYARYDQRVSAFVFVDSDSGKVASVGWYIEAPRWAQEP